jgi:hypothetical protein
MRRRRVQVLAAGVLVLGLAAIAVALVVHDGRREPASPSAVGLDGRHKSYGQLVAANYRVLTPARTAQLLRFANAAYACLSKHIHLGRPQTQRTKIVMALPPGASPRAVAQVGISCAARIGDPPAGSSFQVRRQAVLVYLPKYCILDRKTALGTRTTSAKA